MMKSAAALAGVALVATVLAYYYRSERAARATAFYRAGEDLMAQDRAVDAIEQFRSALSISHSVADRQALGLALVAADRGGEAAIYLEDVLRVHSNNGAANLGMARIRAREGRIDEAAAYYRRAASGSWQQEEAENRLAARLELMDMLDRAGRRSSAQAELLLVVAEARHATQATGRPAQRLGATARGDRRLHEIVQRNPRDGEAWASLGETEFALGEYAGAREPFRKAEELGAGEAVTHDAALSEQVLSLDPRLRGLSTRERRQRSRQLLEKVADTMQACGSERPALSPKSEFTTADIAMAEHLWAQRPAGCKADTALELSMPVLAKD
jgi:tetratricopeptide (TPR) repeat protein